jgi:hypothetical protein
MSLVGRAGSGPGEFASAPLLSLSERDVAAILDVRQGRISFLSPRSFPSSSIEPGFAVRSLVRVDDGSYIVSGMRGEGGQVRALHRLDSGGRVVSSHAPVGARESQFSAWRKLARGPKGEVWAATIAGGFLEERETTGELVRAFRIDDPDLQRELPMRVDWQRETPPPQVTDISVDPEGLLWIYFAIANPAHGGRPPPSGTPRGRLLATRVLIFDPAEGKIILTQTFDQVLRPLGGGSWVFSLHETPSGDNRVVVGRVRLFRP